jgi:hypothetical protein
MGEKVFTKIQYGKELKTAKGTLVDATKIFLGSAPVPSDRQYVHPAYNLALRAAAKDTHLYQQLVDGWPLTVEDGYFQILPLFFSLGLKGDITAAEHTPSQGDYDWAFTPSLTGSNAQDSATFEIGDDTEQYELGYVMAKRLEISGSMGQNQAIKLAAECFAQSVVSGAFTAGLSLPSVEPMVANATKLYIDTTWAGKGGTQKTGLLRDFSLEILTGLHPKFHGGGLTFDAHGEGEIAVMLRMTLEGDAVADGYYDGYKNKTPYAIQLQIPGAQIGTGATHLLKVSLWGVFDEMNPMDSEADGDNLHTCLFKGLYDPTGAAMLAVDVTTNQNAV